MSLNNTKSKLKLFVSVCRVCPSPGLFSLTPQANDDLVSSPWSVWSHCSRHCTQRRRRHCVQDAEQYKDNRMTLKNTRQCRRSSCAAQEIGRKSLMKYRYQVQREARLPQYIEILILTIYTYCGYCSESFTAP